ncbi:bifunctional phosphopantothenoylcysteine decarboxylase/phosphopantothenate--cysteine ligase CoaBC [Deefgea piscis]|uniref:bifunctional phosphopantothenoylcysteine decarboxylase/phosphopantothenate--cysteine ligase CoaBC n=1 Tax=Deefgea piscis TaxID=2739061 RepID=UPI001C7F891F|nr:bifunctional phosphopantothenoylcysteine decarboxylase/phosphopantothenate--cysteine ligase CoaBC [Deefgea piscis]QZA79912.1 bifunctional phosphopantothenoylcysteine decarboxylase/phosphopantothenate--cysteine ligase CoaBC [Deefgea piscis]
MSHKKIVLGITGGVAAYKSAELTRLLVKAGYQVHVVMTEAATHFVGAVTFQALSGHPVFVDQWDARMPNNMAHIDLTRGAAAVLIAPASADMLAKIAQGHCDDLLSTLVAARTCPLLVAPAMNKQMWENAPNQRNVAQLRDDGVAILGPGSGEQACGEVGDGRMLEAAQIFELLEASLQPKRLQGKRVLLTAGPTFERIDAVRGITNSSSGKMGYAIARAAYEAGAEVVLVSGETALPAPIGTRRINVLSAQQMLNAVEAEVDAADIFIAVAAVADYYVLNPSEQKIKKDAHILTLELAPNPDILANITAKENPPFCVGFAAESENLLEYAEAKRKRKKLPLLAANLVQTAMGHDDNEIVLLDDSGETRLARAPKIDIARKLIAHIARLYDAAQLEK